MRGAEGQKKKAGKGNYTNVKRKHELNLKKSFESIEHKVHPIWRQSSELVDHSLLALVVLAVCISLSRHDDCD